MSREYEYELTATRDEVTAILGTVVDGVAGGSLRLHDDDETLAIQVPDDLELEVELEIEDDELSLELELEWPSPEVDVESAAEGHPEEGSRSPVPLAAPEASAGLARFELFRDRNDEWRWRLRHRNGNIIATSGEGYTRKHNARKGIRSVMRNASGAEIGESTEE